MEFKEVILSEDEFYEKFNRIQNHIDSNTSFDGCLFETFGLEEEYVRKVAQKTPKKVWTVLECDGRMYYSSGFHFVNRMGYFITEEEVEEGVEITVELEEVGDDEE
jgi:hypothetical protein